MNKLFTALLLLFSITGSAQVYNLTDYKFSNRVNIGKGGTTFTPTDGCAMLELGVEGTNKTLLIPRGDTVLIAAAKRGAFHYRIADSSLYFYNALKWSKLATTDLLNGYLKLSDTSSMLMPYLRSIDTTSLSNRIQNHVSNDFDTDDTNEFNTGLAVTGNTIEITDAGGTQSASVITSNNTSITGDQLETDINGVASSVDLSPYKQTLSLVGSDLTISNGNTITLPSGGGSVTASNGLNISGSDVKLGGLLTEDTQVYGLQKLELGALRYLAMDADTLTMGLDGFKFLHTTSNGGGSWQYGNMWMGFQAGQAWGTSSTGYGNTSFGRFSQKSLNGTSSTAASNAAFGAGAQENMTTGTLNTSLGVASQGLVTTATGLTTVGHHSGLYSTSADNATFVGRSSGDSCTASETVAIGYYSQHKTYGLYNVGAGAYTGYENTSGNKNTNIGWSAGKNNTTPTENTLVGYLAGGTGIGTSGYNTCIGASSGAAITSGNTNVSVGRASMAALTTGLGNVSIGNNAMNTGNWSNSIVIGRTINVTGDNQLNLGGALYGANIYSTTPRFALGKVAGTNSTFDMGGCALPIILPKSASIPTVGLETAMIYYNSTTNNVDLYDGSWGAIQRKNPVTTATSASGITWGSSITPQVVLNATSNAITQTIPAHSTSYTGWKVEFRVINAASNTVTFSVPSSAYVNGVTGGTSFTASNGNVVTVINDGTQWIITNK